MHQQMDGPELCGCGNLFKAFYVDPYRNIQFWYWCPVCDELEKGRRRA